MTLSFCTEFTPIKFCRPKEDSAFYVVGTNSPTYSITALSSTTAIEGVLVIPELHNGIPITEIGHSAFFGCSEITKVEIKAKITSINKWAFTLTPKLASINIPETVTFIGFYAISVSSSTSNINQGTLNVTFEGESKISLIDSGGISWCKTIIVSFNGLKSFTYKWGLFEHSTTVIICSSTVETFCGKPTTKDLTQCPSTEIEPNIKEGVFHNLSTFSSSLVSIKNGKSMFKVGEPICGYFIDFKVHCSINFSTYGILFPEPKSWIISTSKYITKSKFPNTLIGEAPGSPSKGGIFEMIKTHEASHFRITTTDSKHFCLSKFEVYGTFFFSPFSSNYLSKCYNSEHMFLFSIFIFIVS